MIRSSDAGASDSGTPGSDSGTPGSDSGTPGSDAGRAVDAGAVVVVVAPRTAQVGLNATLQLTATVSGAADRSVSWKVQEGPTGGSVSAGGLYTAPADAGSFHVIATSNADPVAHDQATIAVTAPATGQVGVWENVTPAGVDLVNGACGNYGTETVQADPAHPQDVYTLFMCQGIWKSSDYGLTWRGPINTGTNGAIVGDCAGGITVPPNNTATPPVLYAACIRGAGIGFWRSLNGGVDWTRYAAPGTQYQDLYPVVVDPYDAQHLLMPGHEQNLLLESVNGGQNWSIVVTAAGMQQTGGTGEIFFVNTGNAATTRTTWLWMAQSTGGSVGTWRTPNAGATWTQVDKNEHPHGSSQLYQPDLGGVLYIAGEYSSLGQGVLRSLDYGQTFAHVMGQTASEDIVFGTAKRVYGMFGYPIGVGQSTNPSLESAAQPGTGTWTPGSTPASMTQGPAQAAVLNDGARSIIVTANWNGGVWRYVEPP